MHLRSTSSNNTQPTQGIFLGSVIHRSPQRQDPTGLASGSRALCWLLVLGALGLTSLSAWAQTASVSSLSPTRNARAVSRATNVTITLDQPWPSGTAASQAVRVYSQQAGGKKAGAAAVSGNMLTFNPTTDFKPGEVVFATATTASGLAKPQVYQFTTAAAPAPATFSGTTNVGVGSDPFSVAVGDVDGDGDLDILTANRNS